MDLVDKIMSINTKDYDNLIKESKKFCEHMKGAVNPILILHILEDGGPNYAYQIQQIIETKSEGRYSSLIYPVVKKLEKIGCIVVTEKMITNENRVKKMIAITDTGRAYLDILKTEYEEMNKSFHEIIK